MALYSTVGAIATLRTAKSLYIEIVMPPNKVPATASTSKLMPQDPSKLHSALNRWGLTTAMICVISTGLALSAFLRADAITSTKLDAKDLRIEALKKEIDLRVTILEDARRDQQRRNAQQDKFNQAMIDLMEKK